MTRAFGNGVEEVLGTAQPDICLRTGYAGAKKRFDRRCPKSATSALSQAEDYHAYDVHLFWANVRERVKQQAGLWSRVLLLFRARLLRVFWGLPVFWGSRGEVLHVKILEMSSCRICVGFRVGCCV